MFRKFIGYTIGYADNQPGDNLNHMSELYRTKREANEGKKMLERPSRWEHKYDGAGYPVILKVYAEYKGR